MTSIPENDDSRSINGIDRAGHLLSEVIRSLRFYAETGYSGGDCLSDNMERIRLWDMPQILRGNGVDMNTATGLSNCEECPLYEGPGRGIDGVGSGKVKLMFVIGYPGDSAVTNNSPFAGESGQLLARMISAMKLTPEDVFVSHVVRCRPPDGENPSGQAKRCCAAFLEREIKSIAPEVICTFGEFAARSVLERDNSFPEMQGRFYEKDGIHIISTWHPDEMIADPEKKRPVWEDLQKVMRFLDIG